MPNIQIYYVKRSFDVQKAERFFKERRVPFQAVDMRRHAPGKREIELFARADGGVQALTADSTSAMHIISAASGRILFFTGNIPPYV